jgi:hypothetical protein
MLLVTSRFWFSMVTVVKWWELYGRPAGRLYARSQGQKTGGPTLTILGLQIALANLMVIFFQFCGQYKAIVFSIYRNLEQIEKFFSDVQPWLLV